MRAQQLSPDTTERVLPGAAYTPRCDARLAEDREGFTLYAPLSVRSGGGNLYVRDLHGRDTLLLQRYPDRPVYLVRPRSPDVGEPPLFQPASRDSIWHAAREEGR